MNRGGDKTTGSGKTMSWCLVYGSLDGRTRSKFRPGQCRRPGQDPDERLATGSIGGSPSRVTGSSKTGVGIDGTERRGRGTEIENRGGVERGSALVVYFIGDMVVVFDW